MSDFTVTRHGIDSSGRPILMTNYMAAWWDDVVAELGFRPEIVQGAFMSQVPGGGAKDSSGYHDLGGCIDLRTRDLTTSQIDALIHVTRSRGAASWRRDQSQRHGSMDPHCHVTLGSDEPLSSGARASWGSYLTVGDGLRGPYDDYEWRPDPLVLVPPEADVTPEQIDTIVARTTEAVVKALLDAEKVDKDKTVSVRQAINQIRTAVKR